MKSMKGIELLQITRIIITIPKEHRKMKRKIVLALSIVLVLGFSYTLFYMNQYSIAPEEDTIQASLINWQNKDERKNFELDILGVTPIDQTNSHIVLFETADKNMGYARLLKGWNGKYKITDSGWGDSLVQYTDIKTSDGTYGILVGKNPDLEIDHIIAGIADNEFDFTATVSNAETFVRYQKLPSGLKEAFVSEITLYDESGEIINPLRKER